MAPARLKLLEAEKELTRRAMTLPGGSSRHGFGSTRSIDSRPTRAAPRWQTSFEGAHNSSSIISCLGLTTQLGVLLLPDRGRLQRLRSPPSQPRCHTYSGVAGSSLKVPGLQVADGVDVPLGVIAWERLQLRLKRVVHRGATARGRH